MNAVHQFVPTFEPGAIGNHMLEVQRTLREAGYESEIFSEYFKGAYVGKGHQHTDYGSKFAAKPDDALMYHMAIGSVVADFVKERPERLILDHHNITPIEYYEPWDPGVTYGMSWGRNQLRELAPRNSLGIAHSEYNRRELEALHYAGQTFVVPILLDFATFEHQVDRALLDMAMERKVKGGADWLFVGWIAPHKCQHDIINAFAAYKKMYDPQARLHLVGRTSSQRYHDACKQLIAALGLEDSVFMPGFTTDAELGAYYRFADVLVSMSEHEGVGIPLLESMHHRLPIVAFAAAAVPETVGNAGLVLPRKKPATVAAAVQRVIEDDELRTTLIQRGTERLDLFTLDRTRKQLLDAVATLD